MNDAAPSAGIDVGSTWLDLGFHPFAKPVRPPNSEAGIATIIAALRLRGAGKVALEAIGGYARKLVAALIEAEVLRAAGKPAKVALVAVARRIVTLANALPRDDMTFENAACA